jgi:cytoskeletal protein CcmA (bactofilin family)
MADAAATRSYLGPGCVLDGEITGSGSIECHGSVTGRVNLDGDVVIGERGTAKADLTGTRVVVDGVLIGNATGTEKVEVGEVGQVAGDIRAPSVTFGEGAIFEGNVEMRTARNPGSTQS